ncbi:endonuclease MutS2 [Treponema sp.]
MNEKTIELLEFDTIRLRVAERCQSEEASELLCTELPLTDKALLDELKAIVSELAYLLSNGSNQAQPSIPSIGKLLSRLAVEGASLDLEEAYALGLFVNASESLRSWLSSELAGKRLQALASALPDCSSVSKETFRIVDKDGSLRDLSEFREIKRRIASARRELEAIARSYLSNEETKRMMQSEVPSQRDGRLVLALKANFRNRIKGIVHEVSSSGQTIFVEPEEVVEKNNDILIEERRLASEIARVLRELTSRISEKRLDLIELSHQVLRIDRLRARARYGIENRSVFAIDGSDGNSPSGHLILAKARHPLLGSKAVPIDLSMDCETRVVIITGPNTGGKTVALKTVGLFALLNQFGLAVPSDEGTVLPVFDGVYADIGDEQSISQSLSTFSAHMTNMASIVRSATGQSLVLLDELGSGTDPEEGSAIAMAMLDHFIEVGSRLLTTTHHGILKNYGYTKSGVKNASVDFDSATLSPTYRIVMGLPGESHAIDIASRNGLSAELVQKARSYLDEERADVSELIKGLKEKHREFEDTRKDQLSREEALREAKRKTDLKELRLRQKEHELREQGLGSLRRLLSESRKTLENLVRELREGELTRDKTMKVKDFIAEFEKSVEKEFADHESEAGALRDLERQFQEVKRLEASPKIKSGKQEKLKKPVPSELGPGVAVLTGSSRLRGIIIRAGKKGTWLVELGALKIQIPEDELEAVASLDAPVKAEIGHIDLAGSATAKLELNLLGLRLEEAIQELQRQLDAASLSGIYEFSVVHGKGNGILQRGVHDYLKTQKSVSDYYFSRPEEGGFGKTVVSLKH